MAHAAVENMAKENPQYAEFIKLLAWVLSDGEKPKLAKLWKTAGENVKQDSAG